MQILLTILDQQPRLERWEREPWSEGVEAGPQPIDHRDVYERVVAREKPGEPEPNGPFRRVEEAILRYDIFPPWMVTPVVRRAPVQVRAAGGRRRRGVVALLGGGGHHPHAARVDGELVRVFNDTCAEFYLRLTASTDPTMASEAGVTNDAGTDAPNDESTRS